MPSPECVSALPKFLLGRWELCRVCTHYYKRPISEMLIQYEGWVQIVFLPSSSEAAPDLSTTFQVALCKGSMQEPEGTNQSWLNLHSLTIFVPWGLGAPVAGVKSCLATASRCVASTALRAVRLPSSLMTMEAPGCTLGPLMTACLSSCTFQGVTGWG